MPDRHSNDSPGPSNLQATAILDYQHTAILNVALELHQVHKDDREFVRAAHRYLVNSVRAVYTVNELQPASRTILKKAGSCSQRMACLEAISRAGGIPTRVRALWIKGKFWRPRFRVVHVFVPEKILLIWPQFYLDGSWLDVDELYASAADLAKTSDAGFSNSAESVFDAIYHTPIDFFGKTCTNGCASTFDLSQFVVADDGLFNQRDEVLRWFGSFHATFRGRIFEILYGGRKSG